MNRPSAGSVLSALLSLLVLVACDGDAPGGAGAGPPGSAAACVPGELTLPDGGCQPAGLPPDMACPPGERALPTSADGRCQPAGVPTEACAAGRFVRDGRGGCEAILPEEACPPGQMAVPGESACREVSPCGEGPWGELPVEPTTEYVDQAYPGSDSDGSQQRPWTTVQAGVDAAAAGAIVAVAEGRYEENVLIANKPVRLWGRCPARTEVAGLGAPSGAITVARERASGTEVRGLAVTGSSFGVVVQGARLVVLDALWVHDAGHSGVVVIGRAGVTLRGALVEQNHQVGVHVAGSETTVEATVVRATQPDGAGKFGMGISVQSDQATPADMEFGDGIMVLDELGQSSAMIAATASTGNTRAGVLFVGSTGELSFVRSSDNRFGLVLQGGASGAQPTLGEGTVVDGNAERDRVATGDLPVATAVVPLP